MNYFTPQTLTQALERAELAVADLGLESTDPRRLVPMPTVDLTAAPHCPPRPLDDLRDEWVCGVISCASWMPKPATQTNAHYAPLFTRFQAEVGGAVQFETNCLAYELSQLPGIPDSALVLDAGCGTGRYAAAWRALYPAATVIGVDINRVILRSGQVSRDALVPINGNLEALPFGSGSFDVVMSRGVIQHTPHPELALRELLRVCKPGGLLFFYTYRHGWYDVVLGGFRMIARGLGAPLCSRVIYGGSHLLRLDPRAPTMILDELFVPIRGAFSEETVRGWLHASGIPIASIRAIRHAQFGNIELPVNRRTRWLHRVLPKNGVIALAVWTAAREKPLAASAGAPRDDELARAPAAPQ